MISLITTCDPQRFYLLRPFVEHYRAYGVDAFYINLNFDVKYPVDQHAAYLEQANSILGKLGLSIYSVYVCPFDAMAVRRHHDAIQARIAPHSPWIVSADLDEFHEFPDELHALAAFMESHRMDHVRGRFVDRMARSGFPEFSEGMSIWKQFPLGTDITREILHAYVDKVMLSHSDVALLPGHHFIQSGPTMMPFDGIHPVHHFKWDATVVPRFKRRLEADWKKRCPWWIQSEKGLDWMARMGVADVFTGLRVFDFEDDMQTDDGGPHSSNEKYLWRRSRSASSISSIDKVMDVPTT